MMKQLIILIAILTCGMVHSQDVANIGNMYKIRFLDNKSLPPVSFVKMNIELVDDKTKGTIWIQENVMYKIETENRSGENKFELIDNTGLYTLLTQKEQIQTNEKDPNVSKEDLLKKYQPLVIKDDGSKYIGKRIFLNFDPFLNALDKINASEMMIQGIEENSMGSQLSANYVVSQRVEGIELLKTFYIDCDKLTLVKVEQYMEGNVEEKATFEYRKYKKSDEGYRYPSLIPTPFGDAIVTSIEFNTAFDVMKLRQEIDDIRQ